jgi:hypothetical protein
VSKYEDLTDKLREKYVEDVNGGKKKERTVEDALQEALDNTTAEHAGHPDRTHYEVPEDAEPEWI